jgi:hypothetical protein
MVRLKSLPIATKEVALGRRNNNQRFISFFMQN